MVLMDGTDSTSVTGWYESSTATSVTYTNYYKDDWDYDYDYITEEIEAVRFGWHNPRKIPMPAQPTIPKIMLRIRNQLPYKQRADGKCFITVIINGRFNAVYLLLPTGGYSLNLIK